MVWHHLLMTNTNEMATAATTVSAARSFVYAGNFGRGEFTFEVQVSSRDGELFLSAKCNAQVSEATAKAELLAVTKEVMAQFPGSARTKIVRQGFWHMGRFCVSGFGLTVRAAVAAEAV